MNAALLPLAVAVPTGIAYTYLRVRDLRQPNKARALARGRDIRRLTPRGVEQSAHRLRPGLDRKPPAEDCGILLGELTPGGTELRASFEDTALAIMGPRAGKTTAIAVNAVLDAPGPVVATSNKPDLWMATAETKAPHRSAGREAPTPDIGTVQLSHNSIHTWTFDPQQIVHAEQTWWWNPLTHVNDAEAGYRLATMFVHTVEGENGKDAFWPASARQLLASMFVAANRAREPITTVWDWLNSPSDSTPGDILDDHHEPQLAQSFRGIANGYPPTRDSVYITARVACGCLADQHITNWVTPPHRHINGRPLATFDPTAFIRSHDRLHLLSKDGGGSAAPLVGALTDTVFRTATVLAERSGGRLDPPLVAVLDEAANVCKIDLPMQYSHFGSRGIVPIAILQSWAQGAQTWGHAGIKTLWGNSTVKLVGAGAGDDASFGGDLSRLLGEHDVPTTSYSSGRNGGGQNRSQRRDRIMSGGDIRALPELHALLLANGCRAAWVKLQPWFNGPRRDQIRYAIDKARAGITERSKSA